MDLFKYCGFNNIYIVLPRHKKVLETSNDYPKFVKLKEEVQFHYTGDKKLFGETVSSYDDYQILDLAAIKDGVVISNDHFNDIQREEDESRKKVIRKDVVGFSFTGDLFFLPTDPY